MGGGDEGVWPKKKHFCLCESVFFRNIFRPAMHRVVSEGGPAYHYPWRTPTRGMNAIVNQSQHMIYI